MKEQLVERLAALLDPEAFAVHGRLSPLPEYVTWQTPSADIPRDWEKERRAGLARTKASAYIALANDIIAEAIDKKHEGHGIPDIFAAATMALDRKNPKEPA